MGLRFILGRADREHSTYIFESMKETLEKDVHGAPVFYIVPDQMTFQQEYAFFRERYVKGSIRAQVSSFSRLALRVLQETGGGTRKFISSVGLQMMLRKIIEERQDDWKLFQKSIEKQGFLAQLETMITEFKRYDLSPEALHTHKLELQQYVHKTSSETSLVNKLDDLSYIYEHLQIALSGQYVDGEDQLDMLENRILTTDYFKDAEIYIDGFYSFTPKELNIINALMKKCKRITIALKVNPNVIYEQEMYSELDLFHETKQTYHTLEEMRKSENIKVNNPIILDESYDRFKTTPYLKHLEQNFDERPVPSYSDKTPIQIAEAIHPRAEVEGVAQEILNYVRNEKGRFNDLVIYIRDTEMYHDLITTIFSDYEIPVFVDDKRPMINHALIELIRSLMDVIEGDWRYDAVFRVLKTGFIPQGNEENKLDLDAIDELENYVLEYGIRSRERWFSKKEWVFQRFRGFENTVQTDEDKETEKRINDYKRQVAILLESFDEQMRAAKTIRERCVIIYELLERLEVPNKLEHMRATFDDNGEIEKGREQEQVWDAIIQLFDEIVEMAGSEKLSLPVFRSTLETGFETLEFAHVPPLIDQVIVGTIDLSRINDKKYVFLLGVNEGMWPKKPSETSMISEEERELLKIQGVQLAESSKRQLLDEWFYMYLAFTTTSEKLWISYPISNEEGTSMIPSQLIQRIEEMFPFRPERILLQDPEELFEADRFITTPVKTRAALSSQLSRQERGYPVKDIWFNVLNWYIQHEQKYETTYNVLQSLNYDNSPVQLTEETIHNLYPKEVKTSVSRLEMYHRCSYQHFAQYTLGLQERKTYTLDAPDIGQLFHEALKIITEWVQKEGRDYKELSKKDTLQYAKRAVTNLSPILQNQILHSSKRYEYIQQKLEEVIARATFVLSEQARMSNFSPVGLEVGFGTKDGLEAISIPLPNGFELQLRGRIDRVDKSIVNEQLYLRIVDYKSSSKDLNLVEVYHGLALQMLMYLDVVLKQSEKWLGLHAHPAGVMYFHMHNPIIPETSMLSEDKLEAEIFKKYKMKGLLLEDEEVTSQMDTTLGTSMTSSMIQAGFKKDGTFNAYSKVADEEIFSKLQSHIYHLLVQAGVDITSGGVHLDPYQYKKNYACEYCIFKSVCQFDETLDNNRFVKLNDLEDKQVIEKINKEGELDG